MKNRFKLKAVLPVFLATVVLFATAACGELLYPTGGDTEVTVDQLPVVTMLNNYYAPDAPGADSEIMKQISELTGVNLQVTWVPNTAYNERYNAVLASGDLPNIMLSLEPRNGPTVSGIRGGAFWEVGDYISDYKNLSDLPIGIFDSVKVDGKIYSVYRQRQIARQGITVRKDWLDKLGLEMPTTIEEVYKVAEAFTLNDPDGNGKQDTYGIAEGDNIPFRDVATWLGGGNAWYIEDGKVYQEHMHPAYKESLDFFRELFRNSYMTRDFAVVKNKADNIKNGKAGIIFAVIDNAVSSYNDLFKLFPDAEFDVSNVLVTPNGNATVRASAGYNGVFYFSKASNKTEADLKLSLSFLDKMGNPELCDIVNFGVLGENYTQFGETAVRTAEQKSAYGALGNDIMQLSPFGLFRKNLTESDASELQKKVDNLLISNAKLATTNPAAAFTSETAIAIEREIQVIWVDAQVKYVMGDIDSDGWYAAIDEWLKAGGQKILDEMTEQYNEYN